MAAPKGHPRWGGRKAGTPNKANLEVRNRIEAEGDPVGFLIKVVKGHKIRGQHPSVDQRIRAAERLMAKVAPDLKAVEMVVESEVDATINHDAHDKLLKLMDSKVKCCPHTCDCGAHCCAKNLEKLHVSSLKHGVCHDKCHISNNGIKRDAMRQAMPHAF